MLCDAVALRGDTVGHETRNDAGFFSTTATALVSTDYLNAHTSHGGLAKSQAGKGTKSQAHPHRLPKSTREASTDMLVRLSALPVFCVEQELLL